MIAPKQRAKGSILWSLLFGIFGVLIAFFAAGLNYVVMLVAGIAGSIIGFIIGKKMERMS